jgi:hypothetical protein
MICCFGEVVIWLDRVIACFTGTDVTQHEGMELLVATDQPRQPPMARPAPTFYGAAGGAIAPNAGVRRARGVQGTTFSQ